MQLLPLIKQNWTRQLVVYKREKNLREQKNKNCQKAAMVLTYQKNNDIKKRKWIDTIPKEYENLVKNFKLPSSPG